MWYLIVSIPDLCTLTYFHCCYGNRKWPPKSAKKGKLSFWAKFETFDREVSIVRHDKKDWAVLRHFRVQIGKTGVLIHL